MKHAHNFQNQQSSVLVEVFRVYCTSHEKEGHDRL